MKKQPVLDAGFCRQILGSDGQLTLIVEGVSMEPVLHRGQQITVFTVGVLKPGMCYLFEGEHSMLAHRLIRVDKDIAYFLGDNNYHPERVTKDGIAGIINDGRSDVFHCAVTVINRMYFLLLGQGGKGAWTLNRFRRAGIRCLCIADEMAEKIRFRKKRELS